MDLGTDFRSCRAGVHFSRTVDLCFTLTLVRWVDQSEISRWNDDVSQVLANSRFLFSSVGYAAAAEPRPLGRRPELAGCSASHSRRYIVLEVENRGMRKIGNLRRMGNLGVWLTGGRLP